MNPIRTCTNWLLTAAACGFLWLQPQVTAAVVLSESFEAPAVSGFDDNTVPAVGWVGATNGFGATNRGLYHESVAWPATPLFSTPFGDQAYFLNYSNSGLATAQGATGQTITAGTSYKLPFNAAVLSGSASGSHLVELAAFAASPDTPATVTTTDYGRCRPGHLRWHRPARPAITTATTSNLCQHKQHL